MGAFLYRFGAMCTREEFVAVFDKILDAEIESIRNSYDLPETAVNWVRALHQHSIPGGKMNRGLTVVASLRAIVNRDLTEDELFRSQVLGWCIEWLQGFFLVADDIMDNSLTRRGDPCWYRMEKPLPGAEGEQVGIIACNDSLIVETMMYRIIKRYFRSADYYIDIVELFQEVSFQTEMGQLLDLTSQPNTKVNNLNLFTIDLYRKIVEYKTAYYSFYLPVALAMHMGGIATESNLAAAQKILLQMGEYFQIQDDYLDCYGAPEVIGKVGRDIEENKCGWLVVQALDRCTAEQRKILEEHYGKEDPASVAKVKELYKTLDLEQVFKDYEQSSYEELNSLIQATESTVPAACFTDLLAKIYKRKI